MAFYQEWLANSPTHVGRDFSSYVDGLASRGYVTSKAAAVLKQPRDFDLPTCGQNPLPLNGYTFGTPTVAGAAATMTVSGRYASGQLVVITLQLTKSGSTWSIDAFRCPSP
jgi:hypothetical protein